MPDPSGSTDGRRLVVFAVIACGFTWACAYPAVHAWATRQTPTPGQIGLAGLSATGPLVAALAVTWGTGTTRAIFGPWRTPPVWILAALLAPMAVGVLGRALDAATGGTVETWVFLPSNGEHVAGLVFFSLGEEFGWRGYAQPRLVRRFGPVAGALVLGTLWAVWHGMYIVSPESGRIEPVALIMFAALPAWSVIYVWMMDLAGGSIAIALALHAGAHLDKVDRMPTDAWTTRVWIVAVAWLAAGLAARSLIRARRSPVASRETQALPAP